MPKTTNRGSQPVQIGGAPRQPKPARGARKTKPVATAPWWSEYHGPLTQTYAIPGVAILPLRLFLGITFIYAGFQKLTDPGFFKLGAPTYIGTQMHAFSRGSPIAFLFNAPLEHVVLMGAVIILVEIVVGLLAFLGLLTRPAATAGLLLNLVLFLSATWHVYPYFLGSDIVFVAAWLTLALTGPGAFALDSVVRLPFAQPLRRIVTGPMERARQAAAATDAQDPLAAAVENGSPHPAPSAYTWLTRREALFGGLATVALLILGLWPRGGPGGKVSPAPLPKGSSSGSGSSGNSGSGGSGGNSGSASPPAGRQKVGTTSQIPTNSALATTDPKTGDPAVVVHTTNNQFVAYDAVCTHAGCTVEYDPSYKLLVCPCHGGAFDPAHGAQVVAGPPPAPLTQLAITIDKQGNIFLA